jgi:D-beta-D-heptose 7-phosphate kinase/D-beta-D-heptose 1-phosphate adenosyltransferase
MNGAELLTCLDHFSGVRTGVLGDLMVDEFAYGRARRLSPEAPVPIVEIERRTTQPGGAANVGHNVLTLGGRLSLFGVLGEDDPGYGVRQVLAEQGADVAGVLMLAERPSTVKTRVVAQAQHLLRFDEEDTSELPVAAVAALSEMLLAELSQLNVLIISDYAKGVLTPALVRDVLRACREQGVRTFVDPKPVNIELFGGADVIKPNYHEALRLTGRERDVEPGEMDQVCREVRERTAARSVVITAGARGMFVLAGDVFTHLPGRPREVYDVAGAGDTTLAALALAVAAGADLASAARLANLAGSIAVGKLGIAAVTRDELRAEVKRADGDAQS